MSNTNNVYTQGDGRTFMRVGNFFALREKLIKKYGEDGWKGVFLKTYGPEQLTMSH